MVEAGEVFYTMWGYDQTNYDFIVVEEISPSGKTCLCRMAEVEDKGACGQNDRLLPVAKGRGSQFRMRIDGEYLRGSYPYCYGSPTSKRLGSFRKAEAGREYMQTNPQFGH